MLSSKQRAHAALHAALVRADMKDMFSKDEPRPLAKSTPRVYMRDSPRYSYSLRFVVVTASPSAGGNIAAWIADVCCHACTFRDPHQRGWWLLAWKGITPDGCVTDVHAKFVNTTNSADSDTFWFMHNVDFSFKRDVLTDAIQLHSRGDVLFVSVDAPWGIDLNFDALALYKNYRAPVARLIRNFGQLQRAVGVDTCPVKFRGGRSFAFAVKLHMRRYVSDELAALWVRAAFETATRVEGTWGVKFQHFGDKPSPFGPYFGGTVVLARFFGAWVDTHDDDVGLFSDDDAALTAKTFACEDMAEALRAEPLPRRLSDAYVITVCAADLGTLQWETFGTSAWMK
jgi:hypothetical protein